MEKYEYFSGLPEVGIVPRAPHAGPLLRHVFEQEHGRGGFAGKVSHTYHLYPPTNWLPDETTALDAFARRLGVAAASASAACITRSAWRRRSRPVTSIAAWRASSPTPPSAMNVTAPRAPMDYFFEHHSASMVFFVHEGRGHAGDDVRADRVPPGRLPHHPQGRHAPIRAGARARSTSGCTSRSPAIPRSRSRPPPDVSSRTARSDYRFPRSLDTRNEAGRFEIVSKVERVYTRRVHPTHPFDVIGWRGDYLPYQFAVEDVRPLVADRSHVPPSGHTVFKLPGCYLCVFTVRSVEKEGMWLPFFHQQPRLPRDARLPLRRLLQRGRRGRARHGHAASGRAAARAQARARCRRSWTAPTRACTTRSAIMADFANPAQVSELRARPQPQRLHGRVGAATRPTRASPIAPTGWPRPAPWASAWPTRAIHCARRRTTAAREPAGLSDARG